MSTKRFGRISANVDARLCIDVSPTSGPVRLPGRPEQAKDAPAENWRNLPAWNQITTGRASHTFQPFSCTRPKRH